MPPPSLLQWPATGVGLWVQQTWCGSSIKMGENHLRSLETFSIFLYGNTNLSPFILSHISFIFKNYIGNKQKSMMLFHQTLGVIICKYRLCICCVKYWCYVWKDTNWPLLHCLLTTLMFHYFLQSRDEMDEWILIIVSWWLFFRIIFLDKHQLIWQITNSLLYSVVGIKLLTGTCREHKRTVSPDKMHWMFAMPVFNFNQ